MSTASRYTLGIDLGTTHCALSWVDTQASEGEKVVQGVLPIPQLTAPGAVEARDLLPSFLYLPHASEFAPGDLNLPWPAEASFAVGERAGERCLAHHIAGQAHGRGVKTGGQGEAAAFAFGADRGEADMLAQHLAAAFVHHTGGGTDLGIAVGGDVFLNEVDQTGLTLQQR